MKTTKIDTIVAILSALFVSGCATTTNSPYQPREQTYSRSGNGYHKYSEPSLQQITRHAVRVPQQDAFSVRWFTEVAIRKGSASFNRLGCTISIQNGGHFTAGRYPCQSIEANGGTRTGDRLVVFNDPRHGTQELNLSSFNGGYIQSGSCDRGIRRPFSTETYDVRWSTSHTIRGQTGWLNALVRNTSCEIAPRDVVRLAKQQFRQQQQLEQLRSKNELQLQRLELQEELRRRKQELRDQR